MSDVHCSVLYFYLLFCTFTYTYVHLNFSIINYDDHYKCIIQELSARYSRADNYKLLNLDLSSLHPSVYFLLIYLQCRLWCVRLIISHHWRLELYSVWLSLLIPHSLTRLWLTMFLYLINSFFSDCEECKLEYIDNCLIHPLIPMYDTQVRTIAHCDTVDGPTLRHKVKTQNINIDSLALFNL